MKEQIKAVIREMITDGEIKVGIEWQSLWSELYVTVSIDGEKVAQESVVINQIKSDFD